MSVQRFISIYVRRLALQNILGYGEYLKRQVLVVILLA